MTLGGGQESGRRPGTENVPYIVSLGKAAALLSDGETWKKNAAHMENCRERMIARISKRLNRSMFRINGPQNEMCRLPNTLNISFRGVSAGLLLGKIQDRVAISAGSACHANEKENPSSVLLAMKVPNDFIRGTLRISVGPATRMCDIDEAADIICDAIISQLNTS